MTTDSLTWVTPSGSIGVFLENTTISVQFQATPGDSGNTVIYTILNGSLPGGISLSTSGLLSGTLDSVIIDTTTEFTIRATEYDGSALITVRDRTFSIKVTGITTPYFTTPAGLLFSTNDSVWQSFQLAYVNPDPSIQVNVRLTNGSLPPGLEINSSGLIRGYADIPSSSSATYNFSLQISSSAGSSLPVQYSITVINQASLPGYPGGRNPALLNTQPRSFTVSESDPYAAYYLTSDSIGSFIQDNKFIFKFIGYDFDSDTPENSETLTYDINGLETIGVHNNVETGWQNGTLPQIGTTINTYNVTARVYKTANSTLTSDTFLLTITVVGNIDSTVVWVTPTNLGTINNGAISELSVVAENPSGATLSYRMSSTNINSNLRTIVNTDTTNSAFGELGAYVVGTGSEWTNQTPIQTSLSKYNFSTSYYDAVNSTVVLGGADQNNFSSIGYLTDGIWNAAPVTSPYPVNKITFGNSKYVAVCDNGVILTTSNYNDWSTLATTSVTVDINDVCWDGTNFIAVGDVGVILKSSNGTTWTQQASGVTVNLLGVCYTNSTIVAVGNLGTILTSSDGGTTWQRVSIDSLVNLTSVVSNNLIPNLTVAVGQGGMILRSTDSGATWTEVINRITTTTLYDVIYSGTNFLAVGDAGTILEYSYDFDASSDTVTSPTLDKLPPNLQLLSNGDIVGRLAFESTDSVVPAGTNTSYSFSIQAYDPDIEEITSTKQFTLTTYQEFATPYDNLYIDCYPSVADRDKLSLLLSDDIIPTSYLYRPGDIYFGKSSSVVYQHMFGVPSVATDLFYDSYMAAISKNHYWRNIVLGQIKTAVARDADNNIIYEVVYSEIIDNLINDNGVSVPKEITWPRAIKTDNSNWWTSTIELFTSNGDVTQVNTSSSSEYSRELFPNSLPNMRQQIADTIGFINNSQLLPKWMTSQQIDGNILGYTPAWVICYTTPGKSATVKANIETEWESRGYKLNQINFKIDKFEVDRSMTYDYDGGTTWSALPSAQPAPDPINSQDRYVNIQQKTILPLTPGE